MKRFILIFTAFILCLTPAVFAEPEVELLEITDEQEDAAVEDAAQEPATETEEYTIPEGHPDPVYDGAGILPDEDEQKLREELNGIRKKYNFDVCVYIARDMEEDTTADEAERVYSENGYGLGNDGTGIILYLSTVAMEYTISAKGSALVIFGDSVVNEMMADFKERFNGGDVTGSFSGFADTCRETLAAYIPDSHPDPVYDYAEVLTDDEENALRSVLDKIRERYDFDVCLYTAADMNSDDPWYEANNLYDHLGYGFGVNKDGFMFYHCPSRRKYGFSTKGTGMQIFTEYVLDPMEEKIVACLKNDDFYGAYKAFAEDCEYYLQQAENGITYNEKILTEEERAKNLRVTVITVIIISLIIAFIMMKSKLAKTNTAVKSDYASDYMKPGSLNLTNSKDLFLYSHTSRVRIQTENRSSGGSGGGGGGGGHGGRGGSY